MRSLIRLASFVVVGGLAAAVHLGMVILLVGTFRWPPLAANVGGWMVAFIVSFLGQWQLTFRTRRAPAWQAARRFLAISGTGFAANECAYALLLHWSRLPYDVTLAGVLLAVAVMTYLLSSHWAFGRSPPP
ncbi:GtrA family protein [Ramlibacter sp.]|uniref:GtrA family protein n=1 Tax=Ramlibacter sp. TaxID=1917967 RepID=UPI00260FB6D2|nr:GtrA family protein [Ramlibacter sp.]MDB5954723.1 GtrA family protein [Ramlibacter sp.]